MKTQINLYQPSCYPIRSYFTFKQFIIFASLCALFIITLILVLNYRLVNTLDRAKQQEKVLSQKHDELNLLTIQLKKNRAPQSKIKQQADLEEQISSRQALLKSLSGIELTMAVSFSELMRGLSFANMATISIDSFSINQGRLNISGKAKYSDSVALWLKKVQQTKELASAGFEKISIAYNDKKKVFLFSLSNQVESTAIKVDKND